jgi:HEAT repeat protein
VTDESIAEEKRRPLGEALGEIRAGDLSPRQLSRMSDLSRQDARELAAAWPTIPEETRADLVRRCDELSEERIDLNFGRVLRVAMEDPSAVVRQLAIGGLWEDESSDLLARLRALFDHDASPDVRAEAAAALGRFAGRGAAGSLDEATATGLREDLLRATGEDEPSYTVRRRAMESLGAFGNDPRVAASIADAYDSGDHGLQCSAVYAMGRSLDARWLPNILTELESPEPELRFEAARAAAALGSPDALPALLVAARDEDVEVRHAAIGAIGQIGGRGAARALERLAEEAGEADLELIEAALEEVGTMLDPFQSAP